MMDTRLMQLLLRHVYYKITGLGDDYRSDVKDVACGIQDAHVVSSVRSDSTYNNPIHTVMLDIDYPAYVVESSTEGHYHLYLDVPGGIKHVAYMDLLKALKFAGVIQVGYANQSIKRGYSALRLPWVKK